MESDVLFAAWAVVEGMEQGGPEGGQQHEQVVHEQGRHQSGGVICGRWVEGDTFLVPLRHSPPTDRRRPPATRSQHLSGASWLCITK